MENVKLANVKLAKEWLSIAIKRHERHMNGKEPPNETSQKLMMEEMMYADKALMDGWVVTSLWYDRNIAKYPG